jgi:hypothetical protein
MNTLNVRGRDCRKLIQRGLAIELPPVAMPYRV